MVGRRLRYIRSGHDAVSRNLSHTILTITVNNFKISQSNFQACAEADLMEHLLRRLPTVGPLVVDLMVELMGILASYSITVKELKTLFSAMKAVDGKWVSESLFEGVHITSKRIYRVTIQLMANLPLISKRKFRFGLAWCGLAMPKRNFLL